MEYDLSKYEGQDVYIAIQYITQAGWMLMVDDFYVGPAKLNPSSIKARLPKTRRVRKAAESDAPQSYTVYLDEQEIGSVKTNSFIFENLSAGIHTLGVKSVYKVSESDIADNDVRSSGDFGLCRCKSKSFYERRFFRGSGCELSFRFLSGDRYNQIGNISFCFFEKRGIYD